MSDKNALSIFGKKRTLKALTEFATNTETGAGTSRVLGTDHLSRLLPARSAVSTAIEPSYSKNTTGVTPIPLIWA